MAFDLTIIGRITNIKEFDRATHLTVISDNGRDQGDLNFVYTTNDHMRDRLSKQPLKSKVEMYVPMTTTNKDDSWGDGHYHVNKPLVSFTNLEAKAVRESRM